MDEIEKLLIWLFVKRATDTDSQLVMAQACALIARELARMNDAREAEIERAEMLNLFKT
jgi:hypothetical protein